jgi:4-amino-4-deoxy-L-arabinose transferase-like glycosyltransferase
MQEKLLTWLNKHLTLFLIGLFLLRCLILILEPVALSGDESYYWDWSRQLDWCYYSKPPMVAWLIALSTWLFGDYTAAVRLPTVILGSVCLGYFHATATAFFGSRAAALGLLLLLATPNNVLANLIMTIDPPLYCFWMMSLYYLQQALFRQKPLAWIWAGLATAASLLSKQVAIAIPLMLLVFLLMDRKRRALIRREFLIYLFPLLLAALPILLWNATHDWVMFTHSKTHFTSQVANSALSSLNYAGELILFQFLLISPLICLPILGLSFSYFKCFNRLTAEQQFLFLMGPVLLFGILLLSLIQKVQGNWPMPFYFSGLILLCGAWQQKGYAKKILNYAIKTGFVMVGVTYLLPLILPLLGLVNTRLDPIKRFNYWPGIVATIDTVRKTVLPETENSFVVALGHRNLASQMAFYLMDHPKVFRYEIGGEVKSQYEVWPGPEDFQGKNALVVSEKQIVPNEIQTAFRKFSFLETIPNPMSDNEKYFIYFGEGLQDWPTFPSRHWLNR